MIDLIGDDIDEHAPALFGQLRRPLDVALRRIDRLEGGADGLAVNLAVLRILEAMASRRRLLVVLDDVQWLDRPTHDVLQFAAQIGR